MTQYKYENRNDTDGQTNSLENDFDAYLPAKIFEKGAHPWLAGCFTTTWTCKNCADKNLYCRIDGINEINVETICLI